MSNVSSAAATAAIQLQAAQTQALGTIAAAIFVAVVGTVGAALITSRLQKSRNLQDKESQWRQHAVELTKLEVDRLIKTRGPRYKGRPAILDFLAFYRDLQELNSISPRDLYKKILSSRINAVQEEPCVVLADEGRCIISCAGEGPLGHPRVHLTVKQDIPAVCPYCSQKFIRAH